MGLPIRDGSHACTRYRSRIGCGCATWLTVRSSVSRLVTGQPGLDRELRSVMVTDLPDPSRYLRGGELVVTGLLWRGGARPARERGGGGRRSGG